MSEIVDTSADAATSNGALQDEVSEEISRLVARFDKPVTARRVADWYAFLREFGLSKYIEMYMQARESVRAVKAGEQRLNDEGELTVKVDWGLVQEAMTDPAVLIRMVSIVCNVDAQEAETIGMHEFAFALRFFLPQCAVPIQGLLGIAPVTHRVLAASLTLSGETRQT